MKRLFALTTLLALAILTMGCKKEPVGCSYTVKMSMTGVTASSTPHYDLMAFEYNEDGERMGSIVIEKATSGTSKTFIAKPRSVKVKLYFKMYDDKGSPAWYRWVQQVFYLEQGRNIEVALLNESMVGTKEP